MNERESEDKTADEFEREAASRLLKVRHTFDLRARQILLMEFEQLRALASSKRRETKTRS
jgi:hypothetical protein